MSHIVSTLDGDSTCISHKEYIKQKHIKMIKHKTKRWENNSGGHYIKQYYAYLTPVEVMILFDEKVVARELTHGYSDYIRERIKKGISNNCLYWFDAKDWEKFNK